MTDETTTEAPETVNTAPGVPMTDGQPAEGSNEVAPPGETSPETAQEAAGEPEKVKAPKDVKPRPKRYTAQETDEIVRKSLDKAEISYLRTVCLSDSITIELSGEANDLLEDIAKVLNQPGVFGFAGATKKSQLMEVKHMKNQFGQVTRTHVKYFRRFADPMWEGPAPE